MRDSTRRLMTTTGAVLLLASGGVAAEKATPASPRPGCPGLVAAGTERGPLGPGQQEAIAEALQDEYQGETLYARVLETLGEIRPFSRIVHAERRHAAFLEDLLEGRGLAVPASRWTEVEVPTYASRQEACAAAMDFEFHNVTLYDRLLAQGELPEDVRAVFEHNRMASLEHHQPAFARCAGTSGGPAGVAAAGRDGARGAGARARGQGGCGCGRGGGGAGRCGAGRRGPGRGRCCRGGGPTAPAPAGPGS